MEENTSTTDQATLTEAQPSSTPELIKEKVVEAIKTVYDPEIPIDIWELGLIYDIQVTETLEVVVLMTLTAPNCPEAEGIPIEVENKIRSVHGVTNVKVLLTFFPPWDRNRMSEAALLTLGFY